MAGGVGRIAAVVWGADVVAEGRRMTGRSDISLDGATSSSTTISHDTTVGRGPDGEDIFILKSMKVVEKTKEEGKRFKYFHQAKI